MRYVQTVVVGGRRWSSVVGSPASRGRDFAANEFTGPSSVLGRGGRAYTSVWNVLGRVGARVARKGPLAGDSSANE